MKTKILYRLGAIAAFTCIVYACKKSDSNSDNGTSTTEVQTQSDDQSRVSNEDESSLNDANLVVEAAGSTTGASSYSSAPHSGVVVNSPNPGFVNPICDGTVSFDTANGDHQITITYNGTACPNSGRTRTGTVVISWPIGQHWRDTGAVLTVNFNVSVTRTRDNKTITLTGTHTYTNVTGGTLADLSNEDSVVHTVTSSNMVVTFDNGSKRSWNVARYRKFTYNNGIELQTTGMHTDGTTTGISEWGTNRYGNSFETVITQPKTIMQSCQFQLTSGQVEIIRPALTTTITYGLDANGNPQGCSDSYYFEIIYQFASKSYTFILPY